MLKKIFVISLVILGLTSISFGQKGVSPAKKKVATQLALQTASLFPIQFFEESFKKANDEKSEEAKNEIVDVLLKETESSNFTDERKAKIKAELPNFGEKLKAKMQSLLSSGFNVKDWANKSLEKRYQQIFTLAELQKLNKFFKTDDGKRFIGFFNDKVSAGIREEKPKEVTPEDEAAIGSFAVALGEKTADKFMDVLIINVMDDINVSIQDWGKKMLANLKKSKADGEIRKEIKDFVDNSLNN